MAGDDSDSGDSDDSDNDDESFNEKKHSFTDVLQNRSS